MHWFPRTLLSLVVGAMMGSLIGLCAALAVPIVRPSSGGFSDNIANLGWSILAFDVAAVMGGLAVAGLVFRAIGPRGASPPASSA